MTTSETAASSPDNDHIRDGGVSVRQEDQRHPHLVSGRHQRRDCVSVGKRRVRLQRRGPLGPAGLQQCERGRSRGAPRRGQHGDRRLAQTGTGRGTQGSKGEGGEQGRYLADAVVFMQRREAIKTECHLFTSVASQIPYPHFYSCTSAPNWMPAWFRVRSRSRFHWQSNGRSADLYCTLVSCITKQLLKNCNSFHRKQCHEGGI